MSEWAWVYLSVRLRKHLYQPKLNPSLKGRRVVTRADVFPNEPLACHWCARLLHSGTQDGIPGLGLRQRKTGPASEFGNERPSKTVRPWVRTIAGWEFHPQE